MKRKKRSKEKEYLVLEEHTEYFHKMAKRTNRKYLVLLHQFLVEEEEEQQVDADVKNIPKSIPNLEERKRDRERNEKRKKGKKEKILDNHSKERETEWKGSRQTR